MTDERIGEEALLSAVARLPRGSGVVFRHYSIPVSQRRALFVRVRRLTRRRGLMLLLAGDPALVRRWGADGWHGRAAARGVIRSAPVHDRRELRHAISTRANLVFVSPIFPTRSHPGAPVLGTMRFAALAAFAPMPVIALGGMTPRRARALTPLGAYGWAAIDALALSR